MFSETISKTLSDVCFEKPFFTLMLYYIWFFYSRWIILGFELLYSEEIVHHEWLFGTRLTLNLTPNLCSSLTTYLWIGIQCTNLGHCFMRSTSGSASQCSWGNNLNPSALICIYHFAYYKKKPQSLPFFPSPLYLKTIADFRTQTELQ